MAASSLQKVWMFRKKFCENVREGICKEGFAFLSLPWWRRCWVCKLHWSHTWIPSQLQKLRAKLQKLRAKLYLFLLSRHQVKHLAGCSNPWANLIWNMVSWQAIPLYGNANGKLTKWETCYSKLWIVELMKHQLTDLCGVYISEWVFLTFPQCPSWFTEWHFRVV